MTAKEFVLSKYPNAFCRSKRQPLSKEIMYSIYLNPNERFFVFNYRANWAWAAAKRLIEKQGKEL
jgi:hypothetical protein